MTTDDDDIAILPPRVAEKWYCTKCGAPEGKPERGVLLIDARYALGTCSCTPHRAGYSKPAPVQLVADFAWDQKRFDEEKQNKDERRAWERWSRGVPLKKDEQVLAVKYRNRMGIADGRGGPGDPPG